MPLSDTCDIDIWDKDGLTAIKESQKLDIEYIMRTPKILFQIFSSPLEKSLSKLELENKLSKIIVYRGIICGDKKKLELELSETFGKKIVVIQDDKLKG